MTRNLQADLWDWANEAYLSERVRQSLLALQDHLALNVNMMLWCLWRGARFGDVAESEMRTAVGLSSAWSEAVTINIRKARRAAASPSGPQTSADDEEKKQLYQLLKSAELAAEKIELDSLAALTAKHLLTVAASETAGQSAARRNLASYVRHTDALARPGFSTTSLAALVDMLAANELIGPKKEGSSDAAA